jgi:oxygen-dependent protoporphyrinogen oxidase
LKQSGIRCTLIEKAGQLGGLIRTDTLQGCQLEAGPDSYIATKAAVTELAKQLGGLDSEIIGSNDAERRVYIVRGDRFVDMPKGMSMMVPGDLSTAMKSDLFSVRTKVGFLTEIFRPKRDRQTDFSVRELVASHFGDELLEDVTEPLLSGVYGGDSAQLSAMSVLPRFVTYERQYGSLIRGVRHERREAGPSGSLFLSFRRGMQTLTDALAAELVNFADILHEEAISVDDVSKGWVVRTANATIDATHVVIATPAYAAARLLEQSAAELSIELARIPYSSAILVTLVYHEEDAPIPKGFGFLVPRRERQTIAAATFVGTKWPSRLSPGLVALRAFIVDPESPKLLACGDAELLQLVRRDFERFLKIKAEPQFSTMERWPNSMPQYVVGHEAHRQRISQLASSFPGLYLTGNAYEGVGVPDSVRMAHATANRIASPRN